MSEPVPVVHVTHREGLSSVFVSQVARPMSWLRDRGHDVTLVVLTPVGQFLRSGPRRLWRRRRHEIAEHFGLNMTRLPSPPTRLRNLWEDAAVFGAWLKRRFSEPGRVIVHCRGTEATRLALEVRRNAAQIRVVSDCRGVDGPEFLMTKGYSGLADTPESVRIEAQRRSMRQGDALRSSDWVLCVSEALKREIAREWGMDSGVVQVVPCVADVAAGAAATGGREAMRGRLGVNGRLVVAYCGSLCPWQVPMKHLSVFRAIAGIVPDAHFLAITTEPAGMDEAVRSAGLRADQTTIVSVLPTEVPAYLAAADVGLLVRALSPVNRVASPVKFAEYLSCGVPIILTEGIGDYSALVRERDLGCVLPGLAVDGGARVLLRAFLERLAAEGPTIRRRCLATAEAELGWGSAIDEVRSVYSRVVAR